MASYAENVSIWWRHHATISQQLTVLGHQREHNADCNVVSFSWPPWVSSNVSKHLYSNDNWGINFTHLRAMAVAQIYVDCTKIRYRCPKLVLWSDDHMIGLPWSSVNVVSCGKPLPLGSIKDRVGPLSSVVLPWVNMVHQTSLPGTSLPTELSLSSI